jgi:hypothetical protein
MRALIWLKLVLAVVGFGASVWALRGGVEDRRILQHTKADPRYLALVTGDVLSELAHLAIYAILVLTAVHGLVTRDDFTHDDAALVTITVVMMLSTVNAIVAQYHTLPAIIKHTAQIEIVQLGTAKSTVTESEMSVKEKP